MTKMVQFSDEAYARLKSLKKRDESFSDVVLRLAPKGDLRELWGLRSKREIDEAKEWVARVDALDQEDASGRR